MIIEIKSKSQITIPKEIMQELNIDKGTNLECKVVNGEIVLTPIKFIGKTDIEEIKKKLNDINISEQEYNEIMGILERK
ncbi:MAG: AbrB/MazE/SpoVT family DNA-binding domain-containing protein [Finegoldia magna]|uniref:AbrB/MazE/SpoVT family DNA-binding domain-containing protein n=1 Tax=Finegoldia magna TaxID=1260 RepID=UPI0029066C40|nr:AbrB/MazE/SpoVT family DNA-binding domain-containing protein [Finegoldia magna]MDU5527376.1 AbrB/MazE/SpoVT family DNA-binding domain-containing protein [Finegoldia magna]